MGKKARERMTGKTYSERVGDALDKANLAITEASKRLIRRALSPMLTTPFNTEVPNIEYTQEDLMVGCPICGNKGNGYYPTHFYDIPVYECELCDKVFPFNIEG